MKDSVYKEKLLLHGSDILASANMQLEKQFMQHGNVSVFDHSVAVACTCIWLADLLRIRVDERALVRGALLHDYFLYDWHAVSYTHLTLPTNSRV